MPSVFSNVLRIRAEKIENERAVQLYASIEDQAEVPLAQDALVDVVRQHTGVTLFLASPYIATAVTAVGKLWRQQQLPGQLYMASQFSDAYNLHQEPTAASLGGTRPFCYADYLTYAGMGQSPSKQLEILRQHPVYPALAFVGLDFERFSDVTCHFLAGLGDPRWFVQRLKPDSRKRLVNFLGLGPKRLKYLQQLMDTGVCPHWNLGFLVTAWSGGYLGIPNDMLEDPSRYFWRYAVSQLRDDPIELRPQMICAATSKFIDFMASTWVDNLTPARQYATVTRDGKSYRKLLPSKTYSPSLFEPGHFFAEAKAESYWLTCLESWHAWRSEQRSVL